MPVSTITAFQCSTSFGISFVAGSSRGGDGDVSDLDPEAESCGMLLRDGSTIVTRKGEITFTKVFLYTIGDNPDGTSPNYGFDLEVTGAYSSAVTTEYLFTPSVPHLDPNVPEPKVGNCEITMTLDRVEAERLAGGDTGTADVSVTLKMNTGTP